MDGGILYFNNNTIAKNYGNGRGGLFVVSSNVLINNSIIWGNQPDQITTAHSPALELTFTDVEDSLWPGEGNISIDPLFKDPYSEDFHLMSIACDDPYDSPCIDAGDPNIIDSLLDCSWGLGIPRSDMGAYGGGDSLVTAIFEEYIPIAYRFKLMQNYPNPFNAKTTIRFVMPEPQNMKLTVYDLLGRQVKILVDEYRQAGVHTVTLDASHLTSGIYFYRLQAGEITGTKRMLLLK